MKSNSTRVSRRAFLQGAGAVTAAVAFPTLIPSSLLGANAPSNRIQVGCIGMGRMGRGDATDFLRMDQVRVVAVCDVDARRRREGRELVEGHYAKQKSGQAFQGCAEFEDFRELLARADIDAVSIVTPDHWHAFQAVAAARAGKDIFIQKPLTYTLAEGRVLSDTVKAKGRVLQVGSQQRSDAKFRRACELVRSGRIGKLELIKVGFGLDPAGEIEPDMPVPVDLNYEAWLGPAPWAPYTEKRVHPQVGYDRPGWLRVQDYCHGMITGWGSHHMDIAHWGLGVERSGPRTVEGWGDFPKSGLWNVHGRFHLEYTYAGGIRLICAGTDENKEGVEFIGTEGTVLVRRGHIETSPASILTSDVGEKDVRLYQSDHHKGNFVACIRSRAEPVAPVEIGHRSNSACVLGALAMRLRRKLVWDPETETFPGDAEANALRSRESREPWRLEG